MWYCATLCYFVLHCVTLCYTELQCVALLQWVVLCFNGFHCVTLCYTVLHCVTPYYTALHIRAVAYSQKCQKLYRDNIDIYISATPTVLHYAMLQCCTLCYTCCTLCFTAVFTIVFTVVHCCSLCYIVHCSTVQISGTLETVRGRGVVGQEPVLSRYLFSTL